MKVCILDPGLQTQSGQPSTNLGDLIIQDAVNREVSRLFPGAEILRFATHEPLTGDQLAQLDSVAAILVGGTNLLTSRFRPYNRWNETFQCWTNQWAVNLNDARRIKRATLLGTGWIDYQHEPDVMTKLMYRTILAKQGFHSVRDSYSAQKLKGTGIANVLNTGCVTMWGLAAMDPEEVPTTQAENALVMLTDYRKDHAVDGKLLSLLQERYKEVYVWPQGTEDAAYLQELNFTGVVLERSLPALDAFIGSEISFDYIGTRLHGGIRCLQSRRRILIIEVDNRAAEIAKDTGLPTVKRTDFDFIADWIEQSRPCQLHMNTTAICEWRSAIQDVAARGR